MFRQAKLLRAVARNVANAPAARAFTVRSAIRAAVQVQAPSLQAGISSVPAFAYAPKHSFSTFKSDYEGAVAERGAQGIVPKPLDAEQTGKLVEMLKNPPKGEENFLMDLLSNRVPPGVDEAAYVKAAFLTAGSGVMCCCSLFESWLCALVCCSR
jgi:hypothetical protein